MLSYRSPNYRHFRNLPRKGFRPSSSSTPCSANPAASSTIRRDPPTVLHHAQSTAVSPTSAVHVGTSYEYLCAHALLRLGFTNLIRTGGRSDRGIDLLGYWKPPLLSPTSRGLPVIVQCKATARKPGPEMIRELEGAIAGAPREWREDTTIGVLSAKKECTDGVRQAVKRSSRGLVWVMIEDVDKERGFLAGEDTGGKVKQVLWNARVKEVLGDRVGSGLRYAMGKGGIEKDVCLTVDGRVWEPEMTINHSRAPDRRALIQ